MTRAKLLARHLSVPIEAAHDHAARWPIPLNHDRNTHVLLAVERGPLVERSLAARARAEQTRRPEIPKHEVTLRREEKQRTIAVQRKLTRALRRQRIERLERAHV